ncbi:arylacetamide deacetylase-like 3 [Echinops telfairi]|uniref:Arylacetamide deacetylase-like 3 n=1 Tax=Echinops telfairi TaxID=9371 RepID=A0ABM0IQK4_ECHTE|nr:arylacetamide deacetylase-like 3 [Echinops telfairi]
MLFLLLILLGAGGVLSTGIGLYVICYHLLTADIPAGISHPLKLRIFHCVLLLFMTWGKVLEALKICSLPRFVRFMHDLMPVKQDPDVVVTDLRFGSNPVKLYQPKTSSLTPRTGIIFYHGGGMVLGSLKSYHRICCHLCKVSGSVVLSVGYRQLPEHRFPVPEIDSFASTVHFLRSLKDYGVDPARVVLCGDSLGGTVAARICQKLEERQDLPKIRAQILIYAKMQGLYFQLPSYEQNKNVPMLTRRFATYCFSQYMDINPAWEHVIFKGGHLPTESWEKYRKWLDPENIPQRFKQRGYRPVSRMPLNESAYLEVGLRLERATFPLMVEDEVVARVPEACLVTCEYDFLRDDLLLYKKRLEDLGVPVTWHHMEDGFHGVLNTLTLRFFQFPCSARIMNVIVHFIKGL